MRDRFKPGDGGGSRGRLSRGSQWKERLDSELAELKCTDRMKRAVFAKLEAEPSFWEKKIAIPLPAAALAFAAAVLLLTVLFSPPRMPAPKQAGEQEWIVMETGVFPASRLKP